MEEEKIKEKIEELNKALQQRLQQINQANQVLEKSQAERLHISGQIQAYQEMLEELTEKTDE